MRRRDGNIAVSGGGLPGMRASLSQSRGGAPISGVAQVQPMRAGQASLRPAPVRFTAGGGGTTEVRTTAVINGPVGDGRVTELVVSVVGRVGGRLAYGPGCPPDASRSL